ncbi:MAG TPA: oligopeptide ABC transporter permease [Bacillota bacterium]|nr:oligopeptide ABC transporter permease [Bacillota bacterium]
MNKEDTEVRPFNHELANFGNLYTKSGAFYEFWRAFQKNKPAVTASLLLIIIIITSIAAPLFTSYNPEKIVLDENMLKLPPSAQHFFGTDDLGRDVFSRILFGSRVSLIVGFLTAILSVLIGILYGSVSGYYGGRLDQLLMRFVDILLSLPTMFLLIIFAAFIKPNAVGIALIISSTSWMGIARLVRGEFLRLKEQEFVEAAKSLGFSNPRIIFNHILPNITAPIIVNATLMVAYSILYESTLSFLGLGVQPPQFSWGSMLTNAQDMILLKEAPWIAIFPGLAIFITVLCFNFFGDGLRDALDPKLKNIK